MDNVADNPRTPVERKLKKNPLMKTLKENGGVDNLTKEERDIVVGINS